MASPSYGQIKVKHPPKGSGEAETHFELLGRRLQAGDKILVKTKVGDVGAVVDEECRLLLMDGPLSYQDGLESVPVWEDALGAPPKAGGWGVLLPGRSEMECRWP